MTIYFPVTIGKKIYRPHTVSKIVLINLISIECEGNPELLWFWFTTLYDWFKKLPPPIEPIRCNTITKRDLVIRVFPRLAPVACKAWSFVTTLSHNICCEPMLRPFDLPSQQCCDNIYFVLEMLRGCCGRLTGHGHNMSQQMLWECCDRLIGPYCFVFSSVRSVVYFCYEILLGLVLRHSNENRSNMVI